MPIHNWKKADVGLFHHFHQQWSVKLCVQLKDALPAGYYALIEQNNAGNVEPDVMLTDADSYARRANRIGIRNRLGELVAVVEIVSPGNKDWGHSLQAFVDKTLDFLARGVHVLVIDLFPPAARDPNGIHRAIWEDDYTPPGDKPLTLVSYVGAPSYTAYVEAAAVGDPLPAMPVFLDPDTYVPAPLEETYERTWEKCPREMREFVVNPPA